LNAQRSWGRCHEAGCHTPKYYDGKGDRQAFIDSGKSNDFLTVALHEAGHIIGLSHQFDEDDIMFEHAGSLPYIKEFPDATYRKFSTDDTNGARDLYSVPICVVKTEKAPRLLCKIHQDSPAALTLEMRLTVTRHSWVLMVLDIMKAYSKSLVDSGTENLMGSQLLMQMAMILASAAAYTRAILVQMMKME